MDLINQIKDGLEKAGEPFKISTGVNPATLGYDIGYNYLGPALDKAGLLPQLKTGGAVKGKKGRPVKAILHGGEYVLPANAKPTKAQKAIVASNKRKAKSVYSKN